MPGKIVLEYARRFENLEGELENALAEMRDKSAGRLTVGANESSTLYLLDHIERYRRRYPENEGADPAVVVQQDSVGVDRRGFGVGDAHLRSGGRAVGIEGDLSRIIWHLSFRQRTDWPIERKFRSANWGWRHLSRTTLCLRIGRWCCGSFSGTKCRCNMDVEMPTVEAIRKMVQRNEGVAFLPRMCVEQELRQGTLREVRVKEMNVDRKIRLVIRRGGV